MSALPIWLLVVLAVVLANAPFVNLRIMGVGPVRRSQSVWRCLLELLVAYLVVGVLGLLFEHRAGQIAAQGWEFYVTTLALFVTLAFPGFVYRFLYLR